MSSNLAAWLAPIISIISMYAAQKSYIAITNLLQYEERSERAAKHSDTAAHQLWKTRATQGSSAGAITFSLLSSLFLFTRNFSSSSASNSAWTIVLPGVNITAILAAFFHNQNFWKAKAKVPFVQGFNEGIQKSNEIRQLLVSLGIGWAIIAIAGAVSG